MGPRRFAMTRWLLLMAAVVLGATLQASAQKTATPFPTMAPLDAYLMTDAKAEIALAKSAAPKSISDNAEVMVLDRDGYKKAASGTNGFVCVVFRSWTAGFDDPEFWNPKTRAPICFNPAAARSYLPLMIARTKMVLAGKTKQEMIAAIQAALDKKELPALEVGAMCYMMSKDAYLTDDGDHRLAHLMFFIPFTEAKTWGADVPGSPVFSAEDAADRLTVFVVPVRKWSDGSPADSH